MLSAGRGLRRGDVALSAGVAVLPSRRRPGIIHAARVRLRRRPRRRGPDARRGDRVAHRRRSADAWPAAPDPATQRSPPVSGSEGDATDDHRTAHPRPPRRCTRSVPGRGRVLPGTLLHTDGRIFTASAEHHERPSEETNLETIRKSGRHEGGLQNQGQTRITGYSVSGYWLPPATNSAVLTTSNSTPMPAPSPHSS